MVVSGIAKVKESILSVLLHILSSYLLLNFYDIHNLINGILQHFETVFNWLREKYYF